ncbi:hypothetical protein [Nocardia nova]|uniref:hypothetical protein n=1 Tax=Nocardia nova TaxID=37330 RepID=UPI0033C2E805
MRRSPALVLGPILGLSALITLLVTAFAWPTSQTAPRHLPVGLAGPAAAVEHVRTGLNALGPDALDATVYPDRAAAVTAIENRDIYGAIVVSPSGPEVLTASAASPAVAQALGEAAHRAAAQPVTTAAPVSNPASPQQLSPPLTTDVVAAPPADPRGAVFGLTLVPMVIGGLLTGAALSMLPLGRAVRIGAAISVALIAGFSVAAVLQTWLDVLTGDYVTDAAVIALSVAATALTILGLRAALGIAGIGVGAGILVALGVPLSGAMSAPELLPTGWGTLGTFLPPGAAATALRSTAYFDGAGSAASLTILGCWALGGLALALLPGPIRLPVPSGRSEASPAVRTT